LPAATDAPLPVGEDLGRRHLSSAEEKPVNQTLLLIGLACIIAAVVGGGLKLLGIEILPIDSLPRQALLAAIGVAVLLSNVNLGRAEQASNDGILPSLPSGTPGCYGEYFAGIPGERIATLEEGVDNRHVIRQDQARDEPVGLVFTDAGQPAGALRFRFFPEGELFKIQSVVDPKCDRVEAFENATRPGSAKTMLQNHDALRVRFGDRSYTARFGATSTIHLNFRREP
jgi:hypothetical protein